MNKENLHEINIQEMYPNECNKYDAVIHMKIWNSYNKELKCGDFIENRMISELNNDGTAYFVNFIK